jgi:hypothetical protein
MSSANENPIRSAAPAFYDWDGERWYYNKRMGYHLNRSGSLLHRSLWIKVHGPIPDGYEVNHINRWRHDNRLENLELLTVTNHRRLTVEQRTDAAWTEGRSERTSKGLTEYWKQREARAVVCVECGKTYFSTGMRAKFCDPNCRAAAGRRKNRDARARRRQGERS